MGALTSKPYAFSARSWELSEKENCDFNDFYSSSLKLDFRGFQLMRVRPNPTLSGSDEWISDRSRFSYDSYNVANSIINHRVKINKRPVLFKPFGLWFEDFFVSRFFCLEAPFSRSVPDYTFFSQILYYSSKFGYNFFSSFFDQRMSYFASLPRFSSSFVDRNVFFVGFSLRYTHPLYSLSIRQIKSELANKVRFFSVGPYISNSLEEINIGTSFSTLQNLLRFKSRSSKFADSSSVFFYTSSSKFSTFLLNKFNSFVLPSDSSEFDRCETAFDRQSSRLGPFSVSFSSYFSNSEDFFFPLSHPFARDRFVFKPFSFCYTFFQSSGLKHPDYFFYQFSPIFSALENYAFPRLYSYASRSKYDYSSFYNHYSLNEYLINSKNILLSFKRNQDARHNYLYFL